MHGGSQFERSTPSVRAPWAVVIRSFAFVRKEIVEILRQPRLIGLLVIGPFALLFAFGAGYGQDSLSKRAVFVGSEDSEYAKAIEQYQDDLNSFLDYEGMVPTLEQGRRLLDAGEVDVVVDFPADPLSTVMNGQRAVITVYHAELDPIQETAVEVAARLATQEVNAQVLSTVAAGAQDQIRSADTLSTRFDELAAGVRDDPQATAATARAELDVLQPSLEATGALLGRLQSDDAEAESQLASTERAVDGVSRAIDAVDAEGSGPAEVDQLASSLDVLGGEIGKTLLIDPNVLVRPFTSETDNVAVGHTDPTAFFTPSALALLLQHLALTFAALSLVRDRRTGLFELMRVGPLSSGEIIVGKVLAYLLVGVVVAAALLAATVFLLGVPFAGTVGWLAAIVVGVILSSLALGMLLAIFARTESQAVQYAMLALLAGLFFSGFVLPLDSLRWPVKAISYTLPVRYGIEGFHDVMLRGIAPSTETLIGIAALVVVYGGLAVVGLTRRLRSGGAS